MTAREYLDIPYQTVREIENKTRDMAFYREMACSMPAIQLGDKVITSKNNDAIYEKYIEKVDLLAREISEKRDKLNEVKSDISVKIEKLENENERMVLRYKYLMFMSVPKIADKMSYSERWIKYLHQNAIKSFERLHPSSPPVHPTSP